jgi:hypothetical protein
MDQGSVCSAATLICIIPCDVSFEGRNWPRLSFVSLVGPLDWLGGAVYGT